MSGESEYVGGAVYLVTRKGRSEYAIWDGRAFYGGTVCLSPKEFENITGPLRVLGPDERVVEPCQVVLDLGDDADTAAEQLRRFDRATGGGYCFVIRNRIADQIEAQVKAPRIPEPGWGAVVEAGVEGREGRFLFQRSSALSTAMWYSEDGQSALLWDSLVDPKVTREAVQ